MNNGKMDYDIAIPKTINNSWYPKIRKSIRTGNSWNVNHELEKGGLENSWVLNVGVDYGDLNNRENIYDSDNTDDDTLHDSDDTDDTADDTDDDDRYDRKDVGFIDFGVETTRGNPKRYACEFDEYGNYISKLEAEREAKLEAEREAKLEAEREAEIYPKDRFNGRSFREILWNELKKLTMSEAQQGVGSPYYHDLQQDRLHQDIHPEVHGDQDNSFISPSSSKQTVREDYVNTKILNRRNQELLYGSSTKDIEKYRNYINNVILQNMSMTTIPFCKADTSKSIESGSKIYSAIEIIRDVFHADFREAIKNCIKDHPEQVAEAVGVPMVKDCHLAYVSEPRVQSLYHQAFNFIIVDLVFRTTIDAKVVQTPLECVNDSSAGEKPRRFHLEYRSRYHLNPEKKICSYPVIGPSKCFSEDSITKQDVGRTTEYLLPILSNEEYADTARRMLEIYYKEALIEPMAVDGMKLAKRMGLTVMKVEFDSDSNIQGRIFFDNTKVELETIGSGKYERYIVRDYRGSHMQDTVSGTSGTGSDAVSGAVSGTVSGTGSGTGTGYFSEVGHSNRSNLNNRSNRNIRIVEIEANTILINSKQCKSPEVENSTIIHECCHVFLHSSFFRLQMLCGAPYSSYTSRVRNKKVYKQKNTPIDWMELQAEKLPAFILMEEENTRKMIDLFLTERTYREMYMRNGEQNGTVNGKSSCAQDSANIFSEHRVGQNDEHNPRSDAYNPRSMENIQYVVYNLAKHFKVSKKMAINRMKELGYPEADGIGNYIDGHIIPNHGAPSVVYNSSNCGVNGGKYGDSSSSTSDYVNGYSSSSVGRYVSLWKPGTTYTISRIDAANLIQTSRTFRTALMSGCYVYVEGHYCLDDEKYICRSFDKWHNNVIALTDYARHHINECCLSFTVSGRYAQADYIGGQAARRKTPSSNLHTRHELDAEPGTKESIIQNITFLQDAESWMNLRNNMPTVFSEAVQYILDQKGISQNELAMRLGISRATLRKWCVGRPSVRQIVAICIGLNLRADIGEKLLQTAGFVLIDNLEQNILRGMLFETRDLTVARANEIMQQNQFAPLTNGLDCELMAVR